jgi:hypothetical protein
MDLFTVAGIGVIVLTVGIIVWSIIKLSNVPTSGKNTAGVGSVALSMQDPVLGASSMAMGAADDPDDDLDVSTSAVTRCLRDKADIHVEDDSDFLPVFEETVELQRIVDPDALVDTGTVILPRSEKSDG